MQGQQQVFNVYIAPDALLDFGLAGGQTGATSELDATIDGLGLVTSGLIWTIGNVWPPSFVPFALASGWTGSFGGLNMLAIAWTTSFALPTTTWTNSFGLY